MDARVVDVHGDVWWCVAIVGWEVISIVLD